MANNKMLIDASHPEETRVAMVRGNRVDEFDFESEHKTQLRGNIYLAKVTRVEPSLQAAFVDYGGNRHGFLAFSEIHPDYYQIPVADRQALIDADAEDARIAAAQEAEEDSDDEAVEEKPARKRRSRRKKKPVEASEENSDDSEASGSNESVETTSDPIEKPDADANLNEEADDSADEIGAENDGEDVVSEPASDEKPKRRTSRPRKKKADATDAPDAPAATESVGEAVPTAETTDMPKKRTRRKKAEPKSEAVDETAPVSETVDEAPKPKRRTSRKKATEDVTSSEAESGEETATTDVKPRKRTRRKKSNEEVAENTVPSSEQASDKAASAEPEQTDQDENAEKPKRRRARRSKKAVEDVETSDSADDVVSQEPTSASDEEDNPDSAPKRSRRGRGRGRSKAKTSPEISTDDEAENNDVDSVGAEDALEEVPQRRAPRRHYKIQEVIKRRQILLVQVVKEERGNKGAALTTYLSLAGRYSVLMPNTARGGGISRKITNSSDRKRLKAIASDLDVPQGMGVILRTAGASQDSSEVQRDFEYLMRLWENVRTLTLQSTAPCLVYEEGSLIKRSIRDLYDRDTSEILVAGEAGFKEAKDFMTMLMPDQAKNVKLYRDRVPMFAKLGVEAQLDAMLQPQVTLKSGGYLVINQTEALVAIDVNSGRSTRQHSIEETATQTNLEAADEVARQLRLRDLAGLIVIDFIDMEDRRNNRAVEKRLKDALKHDRARIQVGRISHFGLMEMSRQRIRASVLESTTQICPTCEGVGHVRSASSVGLGILRLIEEQLNKSSRNDLNVKVRSDSALYLLNNKREHLSDLEARFGVTIQIEIDATIGLEPCVIERGEQANRRLPQETAIQPDSPAPEADNDPESPASAEIQQAQTSDQQSSSSEGDSDGPKRRRRRRRKKSDDSADSAQNEDVPSQQDATGSKSSEKVDDASTDEKPKRPRRRTSRAEKSTSTNDISQEKEADSSPVTADAKAPTEHGNDDLAVKSEDDARPVRRRRTTRRRTEEDAESSKSEADSPKETSNELQRPSENESSDDSASKKEGWWKRKFF